MLVISRKTEEFVQIGEDIVIKVIKSTNGSVKIGIQAPDEMRVIRGELQEKTALLPKALPKFRRDSLASEAVDCESAKTAECPARAWFWGAS